MRNIKQLIPLLFLSLVTANICFSQESQPQNIPPSPTAAALAVYGSKPADLYTGVPDIEIPLFHIQDKEVNLPISLKYNAQGIKVQEDASWVGLGWSLLSGGVITRNIHGLDDFNATKGYIFYDQLPDWTPENDPAHPDQDDINYFTDVAKGMIDAEPDQFYYNFGAFSGKLVFKKESAYSNIVKGIDLLKSNIIFQYNLSSQTWTVIDSNGINYYFGTKEISQNYIYVDQQFEYNRENEIGMEFDPNNYNYIPTSWYLDSIIAPSGSIIKFDYDKISHQTRSLLYKSERQHNLLKLQYCHMNDCYKSSSSLNAFDAIHTSSMQITDDVYLKEISYQLGKIEFITDERIDQSFKGENPPQKLKEIKIFSKTGSNYELLKTYHFSHSYYNEGSSEAVELRLRLDTLQEVASGSKKPPYIFSYIKGLLPAKDSKSFDYWGYYNNANNDNILNYSSGRYFSSLIPSTFVLQPPPPVYIKDCWQSNGWDNECANSCSENCQNCWSESFQPKYFFGADREPNPNHSKIGLLEKIKYPTGGHTTFGYEPNTYSDETIKYSRNNLLTSTIDTSFYISSPTFIFLLADVYEIDNMGSVEIRIKKNDTLIAAYDLSTDTIKYDYKYLTEGSYDVIFQNKVNNPGIYFNLKFLDEDSSFVKYGAGLRIKKNTDYYENGSIAKQVNYEYGDSENLTSGKLMSPLIYQSYEVVEEVIDYVSTVCTTQEIYIGFYAMRSGNSFMPLSNSARGSFVGYNTIKEITDGWTIYHYNNYPDILSENFLPGLPSISDQKNGLISRIEYFNKDSSLLKSRDYRYIETQKESVKGLITYHYYLDDTASSNLVKYYDTPIAKIQKEKQIDSIYQDSNYYIVEEEDYFYDNPAHNFVTRKIKSVNGKKFEYKHKYPLDYDTSNVASTEAVALKAMVSKNILSPIIESQILEIENNGIDYLISGTINRYKKYTENVLKPEYIHTLRISSPSADTTSSKINSSGNFVFHSQYEMLPDIGPNKYDLKGNLIETISRSGDTTSYIWGHNGRFPIAKIINASYNSIESVLGVNFDLLGENGDNLSTLQIENLRSNLDQAMITTYTYKPLEGMSSQTDPNGFITKYEYDEFGRLKIVKDQDDNIIKRFTYNYNDLNN